MRALFHFQFHWWSIGRWSPASSGASGATRSSLEEIILDPGRLCRACAQQTWKTDRFSQLHAGWYRNKTDRRKKNSAGCCRATGGCCVDHGNMCNMYSETKLDTVDGGKIHAPVGGLSIFIPWFISFLPSQASMIYRSHHRTCELGQLESLSIAHQLSRPFPAGDSQENNPFWVENSWGKPPCDWLGFSVRPGSRHGILPLFGLSFFHSQRVKWSSSGLISPKVGFYPSPGIFQPENTAESPSWELPKGRFRTPKIKRAGWNVQLGCGALTCVGDSVFFDDIGPRYVMVYNYHIYIYTSYNPIYI